MTGGFQERKGETRKKFKLHLLYDRQTIGNNFKYSSEDRIYILSKTFLPRKIKIPMILYDNLPEDF